MKKIITGFVSVAFIVALMLNVGPTVLGEAGIYMIDEMSNMATAAWEGDGGEYAQNTLNEYSKASEQAIDGLDKMSKEVLSLAEQEAQAEAEENGEEYTKLETEFMNAIDGGCEWVLSFILPAGN